MSNHNHDGQADSRLLRWGIPFTIATVIFFIFPLVSDIYAVRLRELSTAVAALFLRMGTLSVSREGTILSLPGMIFDVIPACSGSNMIRALLFIGILWCGIHPRLTPPRRLLAAMLALPVALLANGIRLSVLLWASYLRGEVIAEGTLHTLIGLTAFAAALPSYFALTELLAVRRGDNRAAASSAGNMLAFTLILMFLAYLPVLSACALAWKGTVYNHNDILGYVFFLIGAGAWSAGWKFTKTDHRFMRTGSIIFCLTATIAIISQIPGPNYYVLGIAMMVSMFAVGLAHRGSYFALRSIPLQFIIFLAFPKVGEIIVSPFHASSIIAILAIKSLLTIIALLLFVRLSRTLSKPATPRPVLAFWPALMTAAAFATLLGQLFLVRSDFSAGARTYFLPYLLGQQAEWEGFDIADSESLIFYERGNVINRQYIRNGEQVGVMIVPSDGNRKVIHTPEYCQMGLGWKASESQNISFTNAEGRTATAKHLTLIHQDTEQKRTFIYWFGDEQGTCIADYPLFVILDTLRKFRGQQTNWSLYVVWSDNGATPAIDFLTVIPIIQPSL